MADRQFATDQRSEVDRSSPRCAGTSRQMTRRELADKEYPPPIPWLGHVINLPPHMGPWVMKKHCTSDGRVIMWTERVQRRGEYLQVHRSGGRVVMYLVPLDVDVEEGCSAEEKIHYADDSGEKIDGSE